MSTKSHWPAAFHWPTWKMAGTQFLNNDGLETAGYLAYTVLVSMFPFLIFLFSIASLFSGDDAMQRVVQQGFAIMPAQVREFASPIITDVLSQPRPGLLTLGLVGALWAAASGIDALRNGLNRAYALPETRNWWQRKRDSLIAIFAASFTAWLVAAGLILLPVLFKYADMWFDLSQEKLQSIALLRFVVAFGLLSVVFWAMYRYLPTPAARKTQSWPGALIAAGLWTLLAGSFSLYLFYFDNYSATYGSLGGVIITLLFLQLSAAVLLVGAEFNAAQYAQLHPKPAPGGAMPASA